MILIPILMAALQTGGNAIPARPVPASAVPIRAPAGDVTPGVTPDGTNPIFLLDSSGAQAPTQPRGRSTSRYRRMGRHEASLGVTDRDRFSGSVVPVSGLVAVRGQEENFVMGFGLVDGLAGTGDSGELVRQLLRNVLLTQNINVDPQALTSKNIAVVRVEAALPAGLKPGRRVDVRVSTIGDAKSLLGGNLMMTELMDMTGGVVYATAAGPVTVGGFAVEGQGANSVKNHVTVGMMPMGGKIEREIPTHIVSEHGFVYLDLKVGQGSFGNVVGVTDAVNSLYPGAALTMPDGKTIRVTVPGDLPEGEHVAFVASLLHQEIRSDDTARVVINERTGVIVIGGDVRLRPGAIAHGSLVVTIAETPQASQPGQFSAGSTSLLDRTALEVTEENNGLVLLPGAVTLQEVVDVLNVLGATPRDLISILTAMSDGGLLVAEIRRM
ncbi:MAG: flagellar P-ring protein precursor FlgI [Chlamydiales bacterium]|jgi:flagellar P-ring protein precursor FlgI